MQTAPIFYLLGSMCFFFADMMRNKNERHRYLVIFCVLIAVALACVKFVEAP